MLKDILQIIFPNLCINCHQTLVLNEKLLCLNCQLELPETQYHLMDENSIEKSLWGKIPFQRAFSFLYFNQEGITQKILHELKYKGNEDLAVLLGKIYGQRLKNSKAVEDIEGIMAIPLHPIKLRKRGYNQSQAFANGLAEVLEIPDYSSLLFRKKNTATQTQKSRIERWNNVKSVFGVKNAETIQNKHILVVDDVITTGATIESCVREIIEKSNCKLSIASIAHAA
jgi:ComF family protein